MLQIIGLFAILAVFFWALLKKPLIALSLATILNLILSFCLFLMMSGQAQILFQLLEKCGGRIPV